MCRMFGVIPGLDPKPLQIEMRKWWDILCTEGPKYGYYPLASKTILIVKPDKLEKARETFDGTGVTITMVSVPP